MTEIERLAEEVSGLYVELEQTGFRAVDELRSIDTELVDPRIATFESQNVAGDWLEPLSGIHLSATEASYDRHPLVSFARFTTAADEQRSSLPIDIAGKRSLGRRIYAINQARSPGARRRKPAASAATTI
ncbi:hypothetical protein [Paraburkholderia caribensis]|uniref:hypothetical protein n=1 Tax=Paraburkholderia caribensis TaxID=75105 RepID=UPI001CC4B108|nr:hypothetical protein [Paraburkholderia caribensis]